ncbi:MAG: hypothetical protein ORN98_01735 [Alphaproteobacteria bacterium]|nr:hypothetical protein [Alphaproteobacteria bacterium]
MTMRKTAPKPVPVILAWREIIPEMAKDLAGCSRTHAKGFEITLNGRPVTTPNGHNLVVPTPQLADAIIAELAETKGRLTGGVTSADLTMTRYGLTAIDRAQGDHRSKIEADLLAKLDFDTIFYRAEQPARLVAEQNRLWQPIIAKLSHYFGGEFHTTTCFSVVRQSDALRQKIAAYLAHLSAHDLVVVANLTGECGSLGLAIAAMTGLVTQSELISASFIEQEVQMQIWGEDDEARARLCDIELEIETILRFFAMCHAGLEE